jgi:Helix-turn-helix domain
MRGKMSDDRAGFTIRDVATYLDCSTQKVRKLIRSGELAAVQIGGPNANIIVLQQSLVDAMERSLLKPYALAEDAAEAKADIENLRLSKIHNDKAVAIAKAAIEGREKAHGVASPVFA